eukprot:TRINITY_DN14022_c0_g6_i1.p1 TRINITY_DN14022_c0_g6~~TRINITY_DN14022_c0_g6_i1.p1  ORF type:complete len:352 (+),score=35.22 TRINITY_DN14022_c0_g6_i1:43-1098(+)
MVWFHLLSQLSYLVLVRSFHLQARLRGNDDAHDLKIVYGVMTNNNAEYQEKLRGQLDTWARPLADSGRFFAVVGSGAQQVNETVVEAECDDSEFGVSCKEAEIMAQGVNRNADWLVVLGDDNWVNVHEFEAMLREHTVANPAILGIVGCQLNYLGTCVGVSEEDVTKGSLCGGGGYAVNRAALATLSDGNASTLHATYASFAADSWFGDMATSCLARQRHVDLINIDTLFGFRMTTEQEIRDNVKRALTLHYLTGDAMRWLQLRVEADENEANADNTRLQELEAAAFDEGCCCTYFDSELDECKSKLRQAEDLRSLEGVRPSSASSQDLMQRLHEMNVAAGNLAHQRLRES